MVASCQPHVLSMSATPIPRTLALVRYGSCAVSALDEAPPNRKRVVTTLVEDEESARAHMFAHVRAEVESGGEAGRFFGTRMAVSVFCELRSMDAFNLHTRSTRLDVQLEPVVVLSLLAGCRFGCFCKITRAAPPDINPSHVKQQNLIPSLVALQFRTKKEKTKKKQKKISFRAMSNNEQLPTHLVFNFDCQSRREHQQVCPLPDRYAASVRMCQVGPLVLAVLQAWWRASVVAVSLS